MHRQFQHQRHHHYNHWPWPEMEWKYFFFRLVLDWSWIVPPVDKTLFHPSLHFRRKKTFWHLKVWFDVGHSRSRCNSKEKTESVLEQSFKKSYSYHSCSLPDTEGHKIDHCFFRGKHDGNTERDWCQIAWFETLITGIFYIFLVPEFVLSQNSLFSLWVFKSFVKVENVLSSLFPVNVALPVFKHNLRFFLLQKRV